MAGSLARARAHWVSGDTIAWDPAVNAANLASAQFALHRAPQGGLMLGADGVEGGLAPIPLHYDPAGLSPELCERFPHLASYTALRVPADRLAEVPEALRGQLAVSAATAAGET